MQLVESTPAGYSNISDYDHTTTAPDTDGNDTGQGADDNIPVRLLPGETDADNNFINGTPGLICGSVKNDLGIGIAGVDVELYEDTNNNDSLDVADILVNTATSAPVTGNYCFEDVIPGEYVIAEVHPANYFSVSDFDASTGSFDPDGGAQAGDPDNEIAVTLEPNELDGDNNFVEDPFVANIDGYVMNDLNAGMPGVTISLYLDTNGDGLPNGGAIATTSTNGTGYYTFNDIEPGTYVVVESSPLYFLDISDYDHTTSAPDTDGDDSAQGADNNIPVILLPGETDSDNNFENGRPGLICGNVSDNLGQPISSVIIMLYHDLNDNDALDAGDTLVATTLTDGDTGDYCFEDITPAEYLVSETQPVNFTSVSDFDETTAPPDTDGDDQADGPDDEIPVTLNPGEVDTENDFVDAPVPGAINGSVVNEMTDPLENVKVYLYADTNGDGNEDGAPIDSVYSNVTGFFAFSGLLPGDYVLVQVNMSYFSDISDYDSSTSSIDNDGDDSGSGADNDIPVTIQPAEVDIDNMFMDGRPGKICGRVENDLGDPMENMS